MFIFDEIDRENLSKIDLDATLGDAAEPDEPRLVSGAVVREPSGGSHDARLLYGCGGAALCMQSGGGSRRSRPAHVARRA